MDTKNTNTGHYNTGHYNTGHRNTGHYNTGDWNTGHYNTGHYNTGYRNTGYRNTGDYNTGDYNTGYWNACNQETGYFNTVESDTIRVFNKECSRKEWVEAEKPDFLYFNLTEWVPLKNMTDEEKKANPSAETTGGYLKAYDYKEAFQRSYEKASDEDKALLLKLPNFDAAVFKEISGIDVSAPTAPREITVDGVKYVRAS